MKHRDAQRVNHDPATVGAWAATAGSCETTIHATCKMLKPSARDSRDFARVLRALRKSAGSLRDIEGELHVMEPRTWRGLLERSGLAGRSAASALAFEEYLRVQRFVRSDHRALAALTAAMVTTHP